MARRYATGIAILKHCGAVSSLGGTWEENWNSLMRGEAHFQSGADICPGWPDLSPAAMVAEAGGWTRQPDFLYRFQRLAHDAVRQIQAPVAELAKGGNVRAALLIAGSHGDPGPVTVVVNHARQGVSPPPEALRGLLQEKLAETIFSGLGLTLPVYAVSGTCASSIIGTSYAADMINAGLYDMVVFVGIDSMSRITASGFYNIGAAAGSSSVRPYDRTRDGTIVGEGAAAYVLCREELLQETEIKGRVIGTSVYCDAVHPVAPDPDGVAKVLRGAMSQAGIGAGDICGVYWHGTGTRRNDEAESLAARLVFGAKSPPGTSTKGSLGHAMGASGGFNILAACETSAAGRMPHVRALLSPEYPHLNIVRGQSREIKKGPLLVVASGFGGLNAAAVIAPAAWRATP